MTAHLAVAHAGVRENMLGRNSPRARDFGLYGDSSGRPAADGLPERFNWAADYGGKTAVVYGHTPVAEPEWLNNTMCIDTGCVFGGQPDGAALAGARVGLGAGARSVRRPAPRLRPAAARAHRAKRRAETRVCARTSIRYNAAP